MSSSPRELELQLPTKRLVILLVLLIALPMLGAQLGVNLSIVSRVIAISTGAILEVILRITGNV